MSIIKNSARYNFQLGDDGLYFLASYLYKNPDMDLVFDPVDLGLKAQKEKGKPTTFIYTIGNRPFAAKLICF